MPGWESWKTLLSVTAYHSFSGEVEARTPPRYAALPFHGAMAAGRGTGAPAARLAARDPGGARHDGGATGGPSQSFATEGLKWKMPSSAQLGCGSQRDRPVPQPT